VCWYQPTERWGSYLKINSPGSKPELSLISPAYIVLTLHSLSLSLSLSRSCSVYGDWARFACAQPPLRGLGCRFNVDRFPGRSTLVPDSFGMEQMVASSVSSESTSQFVLGGAFQTRLAAVLHEKDPHGLGHRECLLRWEKRAHLCPCDQSAVLQILQWDLYNKCSPVHLILLREVKSCSAFCVSLPLRCAKAQQGANKSVVLQGKCYE
jgi:hypothetical protein